MQSSETVGQTRYKHLKSLNETISKFVEKLFEFIRLFKDTLTLYFVGQGIKI